MSMESRLNRLEPAVNKLAHEHARRHCPPCRERAQLGRVVLVCGENAKPGQSECDLSACPECGSPWRAVRRIVLVD